MIASPQPRPAVTPIDGLSAPVLRCTRRESVVGPDPASAFAALASAGEPTWLWWTADGDVALGVGEALRVGGDTTITWSDPGDMDPGGPILSGATDAERFRSVGALRRVIDASVVGEVPLWFAGFSFAPGGALPPPWSAFRRNDAAVPTVTLRAREDGSREVRWDVSTASVGDRDARIAEERFAHLVDMFGRPSDDRVDASSSMPVGDDPAGRSAWHAAVDNALERIDAGTADKLVLARELHTHGADAFDIAAVIRRLRRRQPSAYVFAVAHGTHVFCGASPELLVRSDGRTVRSLPLAGTARHADGTLAVDPKSRHEHALLADAVREALTPFCTTVESDVEPAELSSGPVVHLATRVEGALLPDVAVTDLLAALHPTPAVGATPRAAAGSLREIDGVERGLYAGAVGTMQGDSGEYALALRCGVIDRSDATLYAGAGIVRGSDPDAEFDETEAKFSTMLDALGASGAPTMPTADAR